MSFTEIENELQNLTPHQLRELALKSWQAYITQEEASPSGHECSEDDPHVLAALDEAVTQADRAKNGGYSGDEVRQRLGQWTSR